VANLALRVAFLTLFVANSELRVACSTLLVANLGLRAETSEQKDPRLDLLDGNCRFGSGWAKLVANQLNGELIQLCDAKFLLTGDQSQRSGGGLVRRDDKDFREAAERVLLGVGMLWRR